MLDQTGCAMEVIGLKTNRAFRQKEMMEYMIPWGIECFRYITNSSSSENRNNSKSVLKLKNEDIIKDDAVGTKGELKRKHRYYLTAHGVDVLISKVLPVCVARHIPQNINMSIKGDINLDMQYRYVNRADAQCFLTSLGVVDPCRVVYEYEQDPFIFGYPSFYREKDSKPTLCNLAKVLIDAHVSEVIDEGLSSVLAEESIHSMFLPNAMNPATKISNISGDKTKAFNNSIGIIFDFSNKYAYMVFKYSKKSDFGWVPRAYRSMLANINRVISKIGIRNIDGANYIKTAIVLCETDSEIKEKAKLAAAANKYSQPFDTVIPILMKAEGADIMDGILSFGYEKYMNLSNQEVLLQIDGIQERKSLNRADGYSYWTKDNIEVVNGTIVNYSFISEFMNTRTLYGEQGKQYKIACFENQRDLYLNYAGFEESDLIIVADNS